MLTQNIQVLGERNPKDKLNNINLTRSVRLNDLTQEEMAELYRRGQTSLEAGSLNNGFNFNYYFQARNIFLGLDVVAITFDSVTQAVVFDCGYSTVYNRYFRVLLTKGTDGTYSWSQRITVPNWVDEDNIKTINGESLVGTGDIEIAAGVESLNGQTGSISLKTVNGNELVGTGNIEIKGGGDATPTGTTLYFTTTDGQTLNANIEAKNSAGTVIEPSLKTPTAWYYDEVVETMNIPSQTITSCNLYSLNGVNIPVNFRSTSYQHDGLRKILENCVYADLRKFFQWNNTQDLEYMFNGLKKLKWMDVSNFITSDVLHMRYMFANCEALTSLDLSKWDTSNVTNMSGMFSDCSNLLLLDVSNFNPSKVLSMNSMFQFCERLITLDLSKWNASNVTDMGSMFRACRGLLSLDLSHFNTSKVTDMSGIFEACWRLTSLNLSNWDLANVTSMGSMFSSCDALRTITMKNCSTGTVDKIKAALTEAGILSNVQIITQ